MLTKEEKRILKKTEELRRKIRAEKEEYREISREAERIGERRDSRYSRPTGGSADAYSAEGRPGNGYHAEKGRCSGGDAYPGAGYSKGRDETAAGEPAPAETEKKKKKFHILPVLFLLLVLFSVFLFLTVFLFSMKTDVRPFDPIAESADWGLLPEGTENVTNILLIGTDARAADDDSRSDAIIVASLCPKQKKIYLTSILRDCYTVIPGYGQNRINHAYQMGGPKLLIETIEQNFHIRIDAYMKVDFFAFIDIIDSLGGVEITVAPEEVHYVNAYLCEVNLILGLDPEDAFIPTEGTYMMNGRQALAYARIRYIGTDFARTQRQRTVIEAAVRKVKQKPWKVFSAGSQVFSDLTTDLDPFAMTKTVFRFLFAAGYDIETEHVPIDGLWWNDLTPSGQEVLNMDFGATSDALRTMIYGY